jgi:hypothetical protein
MQSRCGISPRYFRSRVQWRQFPQVTPDTSRVPPAFVRTQRQNFTHATGRLSVLLSTKRASPSTNGQANLLATFSSAVVSSAAKMSAHERQLALPPIWARPKIVLDPASQFAILDSH